MKNEVLKCIYTRRSVRNYKNIPVPKDVVDELLNAAVMAPSARNTQPWLFSIVEGQEKIGELGERALVWYNKANPANALSSAAAIFYNAPLAVIISGKSGYKWLKDDVNLAVQNMFLAAQSLGLGSCWIGRAIGLNND